MLDIFKNKKKKVVVKPLSELENIIKKIKSDTNYYKKIPGKYKNDKSVIITLLKKEDFHYNKLNAIDKENIELYKNIILITKDASILKYAGKKVKEDLECVLLSVKITPYSIDYVNKIANIQDKKELENILYYVVSKNKELINFINNNLLIQAGITKEELLNNNNYNNFTEHNQKILDKHIKSKKIEEKQKRYSMRELINSNRK